MFFRRLNNNQLSMTLDFIQFPDFLLQLDLSHNAFTGAIPFNYGFATTITDM